MSGLTESIAREYFDAFNQRDWDGERRLLHEEYSYTGRGGARREGPEAGIANSQFYANAFPGLQLEVRKIHASGDVAVVEFVPTLNGQPLGGSPGEGPVPWICTVLEIREGKVHTEREYWQQVPPQTGG
jgi:ketosteroid isomerase-like protein